ncbi:uncharacterized protein LOC129767117 [Toxorhynchites rutilus septentrionalis]|uniref:uncharacterized protein LOC129767117 n=1 Tax=Toxorhynchites rutilus septentrionalis TaxID=329112 RepID=UPI002478734A|nr:uncharacterized protein LOC129767117 [Toxorhynchites rutilus septentrionalis]
MTDNLEGVLEKFWKIDSMEDHHPWSKEEQDCEAHFVHTHERAEDGRYVMRLTRKLEQKLGKNEVMKEQYHSFMREYLARKVSVEDTSTGKFGTAERKAYYLPHHAVLKNASTTTKLRVVFDGSACTDSGYSLNDALMKGPIIQDELLTLLLRFRKHQVALVGDIEKMYRQVFGGRSHRNIRATHCNIWIDTVIVSGNTSNQTISNHPEVCAPLERDMYVDDYIGGAASVESACYLRISMDILTSKGGFPVRKWCSNRAEVLVGIPMDQLGTSLTISFDLDPEEKIKALGITWEPESDQLRFVYNIDGSESAWTRRRILSAIARLFDPLGLISPVVITAKMIMQELALLQTNWDIPVPPHIETKWINFHSQLNKLSELRISRFAFIAEWVDIQFHCFSDASELAYGACDYVRTMDQTGNVRIELISSKSRVAPLKRLSLRLELSAVQEAARLHEKIIKALTLDNVCSYFWSDSTVVLHWLKAPPNTWKTFVANRVSVI